MRKATGLTVYIISSLHYSELGMRRSILNPYVIVA